MANAGPIRSSLWLRGVALAAVAATPGVPASAGDAPPANLSSDEVAQLRSTVANLQQRVDELEGATSADWLTRQRADEIRGLVHDVLADADTRASLLQSGAAAGYDNGFFIGSGDGNYLLRIAGQVQVRAVYNTQDESPSDDDRFGFESRRTKIDFRGNVVDPSWTYYVELDVARSTGAFALGENGWIQKDLGNGWKLRFGQFKPMFTREETISSRRLQSLERSQVNSQFTVGTAQGLQAMYEADSWRLIGSFIDGASTPNSPWSAEDTEYAFTARGEWLVNGDWKSVEDDVSFRDVPAAFVVGGGLLYQRAEFGTGSGLPPPDFNNAELENLTLTADAALKFQGASVIAAVFFRDLSTDTGAVTDIDREQIAFMLRGGWFVQDDLELYAMYEWGDLDTPGVDDLSVITVGATKYFAKHNLKWQNDIGFGLDSVASAWAVDSAGWRADSADNDGQIVIRSQFQLLF